MRTFCVKNLVHWVHASIVSRFHGQEGVNNFLKGIHVLSPGHFRKERGQMKNAKKDVKKTINQEAGTWLVDWLRVPTPMRAIRVRAWVEVVGFVMELFHCRVQ